MRTNYYTCKLTKSFPSIMFADRRSPDDRDSMPVSYTKYALVSKRGFKYLSPTIPYLDGVRESFKDSKLNRRIAVVTDNIYLAVRTAHYLLNACSEVCTDARMPYYYDDTSNDFWFQKSAKELQVFDFSKLEWQNPWQNPWKNNTISPIRNLASCYNLLFVGMRDCADPETIARLMNDSGGRVQFLMVSEEDLESEWFEELQRSQDTPVIHLKEPDDSYYLEIAKMLILSRESEYCENDLPKIIKLAREKYGVGKKQVISEEDLAWFLDKACLNKRLFKEVKGNE